MHFPRNNYQLIVSFLVKIKHGLNNNFLFYLFFEIIFSKFKTLAGLNFVIFSIIKQVDKYLYDNCNFKLYSIKQNYNF